MNPVRHVQVGEDGEGQRVDNYLLKILKKVPRARIYRMLRKGEVRVDGKRVDPVYRLQLGQTLRIPPVVTAETGGAPRPPSVLVDALERRIVEENDRFIVLDKPAGTAVHAGSGVALGVIETLKAVRTGFLELVHRLDRDTSGLLLLAKTPASLKALQSAFRARTIDKRYRLVVYGRFHDGHVHVDQPLLRYVTPSGERRVRTDALQGQTAHTRFTPLETGLRVSTLAAELLTGRTHQIRVHAAALGHGVVGDDKYGLEGQRDREIEAAAGRLLLHAERLEFALEGRQYTFTSPVPGIFAQIQARFG